MSLNRILKWMKRPCIPLMGAFFCTSCACGVDTGQTRVGKQSTARIVEVNPGASSVQGHGDVDLSTRKETAPEKKEPPLYAIAAQPLSLEVPGFNDASHVTPATEDGTPRPVVIVLHGNFDRPEWQCEMWQQVASWYGWVLCPRGVRTPFATLAEDRWTYRGGAKRVSEEITAALAALENRYPGAVQREGMVLVGFSLGAILLPEIVQLHPGWFASVVLIEGGLKQLDGFLLSVKRNGVERVGLAMSTPANRERIPAIRKKINRNGLVSVYVDMRGAGHNYRMDFPETGQQGLRELLERPKDEMNGAAE